MRAQLLFQSCSADLDTFSGGCTSQHRTVSCIDTSGFAIRTQERCHLIITLFFSPRFAHNFCDSATMSSKHSNDGDDDGDSFSKVGLSDSGAESVASSDEEEASSFILLPKKKEEDIEGRGSDNAKSGIDAKVVYQVQLPPHFSAGGSVTGADVCAKQRTTGDSISLQSEASSFIPIRSFGRLEMGQNPDENEDNDDGLDIIDGDTKRIPRLKLKDTNSDCKKPAEGEVKFPSRAAAKDDDSEASDWSVISSLQNMKEKLADYSAYSPNDGDDASVAGSSTISGFDLISLNGSTNQKKCPKCSFLNGCDDSICKGCYLALIANPNMEADEKLARSLQQQEEQEAFRETLSRQKKRRSLGQETVLFRAQTLSNDILSVIEACRMTTPSHCNTEGVGFCALPHASLTVLASRFIDCVDEMTDPTQDFVNPVTLCYCYTGKDAHIMSRIRQDGFGPCARFGSTPEAALKAFSKYGLGRFKFSGTLETIREQGCSDNTPHAPAVQGWIAAIVSSGRSSSVPVSSGNALVYARKRSVQSLPLVSFDATLFEKDIIRRLVNGLTTACRDFFSDCVLSDAPEPNYQSCQNSGAGEVKRRKVDTDSGSPSGSFGDDDKTDDEVIALALQNSLYEEDEDDSLLFEKSPDRHNSSSAAAAAAAAAPPPPPPPPQPNHPHLTHSSDDIGTLDATACTEPLSSDDDVEALVDKALRAWWKGSSGRSFNIATEPTLVGTSGRLEYDPCDADADGLVRVGVEADDARAQSLEAAAASMKQADGFLS